MDARRWTLGEVAERTEGKRRALQLWADGGVIHSTPETDRSGTGVHRLFTSREVQVAALLVPLAEMGLQIGVLRFTGDVLRGAFTAMRMTGGPDELCELMEKKGFEIKDALERAANGLGSNYLVLAYFGDDLWIHAATDVAGPVTINPAVDFAHANLPKTAAMVILDLTKILRSLLD